MNSSFNEQYAALQLAELMPQLCRAMMRRELSCTSDAGATAQQIWALEIIREQKSCPQRRLLTALQLKASTGTVFINRLHKQGLVTRSENPDNRRTILLTLTRKGETTLAQAVKQRTKEALKMLKLIPPSKQRNHIKLFEDLLGILKD